MKTRQGIHGGGWCQTLPLLLPRMLVSVVIIIALLPMLGKSLQLQVAPLISGPSWLPLHVKVVVSVVGDDWNDDVDDNEHVHVWDFVPLNATSPKTLQSLLSLQAVPGEIRHVYKRASSNKEDAHGGDVVTTSTSAVQQQQQQQASSTSSLRIVAKAQEFVDSYTNRDLHLIYNNCWTFALMLYFHLSASADDERQ